METLGSTDHASGAADPRRPRLSVIVPVRDGASFLADSLPALRASDLPGEAWELVVVDDASRDASADVAARFADVVLRQPESRGPAAARNRGVRHSRGDILVFIDADVSVHGDTLRRLDDAFRADAGIAGVFGAYDAAPRARGLVSQYRNLLHHRIHAQARGEAETFWAGLGAIRRGVFVAAGEFDETMRQLEDIDLGYRVRALGHRILLRPEIQGTHLKRWTLRRMVVTDLFGRGVTWMRLHLAQGRAGRPGTLNLRPAEKLFTLLTGAAAVALGVGIIRRHPPWLIASGLCLTVGDPGQPAAAAVVRAGARASVRPSSRTLAIALLSPQRHRRRARGRPASHRTPAASRLERSCSAGRAYRSLMACARGSFEGTAARILRHACLVPVLTVRSHQMAARDRSAARGDRGRPRPVIEVLERQKFGNAGQRAPARRRRQAVPSSTVCPRHQRADFRTSAGPQNVAREWQAVMPPRNIDGLRSGDRIVICGAGPAGLTAAYLLTKAGHPVTVLEADRLVGGLARTVEHQGYRFDIGGHRFFTQLPVVQALWEELLDGQMIDVPRLSRIYYKGRYFQYPLQLVDALQGLGPVECARILLSYTRARLFPARQVENFEQWVSNRFGGRLYRLFFKTYTEKVWGIPCTEIRAEWAAQRIQGLSLMRAHCCPPRP